MVKLLFISYINRSGSTFLANEFSKYDSILVCPEAEVLFYYFIQQEEPLYCQHEKLFRLLSEIFLRDPKLKYWDLKISDFNDLDKYQNNFEIFFDILRKYRNQVKPEANTIVFKADIIAYFYKKIPKEYYENNCLKIISIIRDGRASYASQRETIGSRKQKPMNRNPIKSAKLWKNWMKFLTKHKEDSRFIIIRYEKLILNFRYNFRNLLAEVGLKNKIGRKKNKGDLYDRIPTNQKSMHKNILKPPLHENIDKWRYLLPLSHIAIFEKIAGKELAQNDYDLIKPESNRIWTCFLYIYFWLTYSYHSSIFRRRIRKVGKFLVYKAEKIFIRNPSTTSK